MLHRPIPSKQVVFRDGEKGWGGRRQSPSHFKSKCVKQVRAVCVCYPSAGVKAQVYTYRDTITTP